MALVWREYPPGVESTSQEESWLTDPHTTVALHIFRPVFPVLARLHQRQ